MGPRKLIPNQTKAIMSPLDRPTDFEAGPRTETRALVSDDVAVLCAPPSGTLALVIGLFVVPAACAGGIVMLYSLGFPSAEKIRQNTMERALVSCRAAIIASANAPTIDWRVMLRAPNHSSVTANQISFSWHDDVINVTGAKHRRAPATCQWTYSTGMLTGLKINGDTRP
jgi:hypothetical protein